MNRFAFLLQIWVVIYGFLRRSVAKQELREKMSRRVALTRSIRRARRVIDNFESFFARSWIILITELERRVVSFPSRVRGFISSGVIAASTKQSRERHVCLSLIHI